MNDFKKNNRFGGGFKKGGFGKRPGFGNRGGFGDRGGFRGGRDIEMHSAVCASCGKTCEVPFRPNGKKPIYCKECFAENGGPSLADRNDRRDRGFQSDRRERFAPEQRNSFVVGAHSAPKQDAGLAEVKRQIEALSAKVDKIMAILSPAPVAAAPVAEAKKEEAKAAPAAKKPSAKKAVAKKKK